MFNALNHTNFTGFETNISSGANFGRATAARGPREIQFGLKFSF
jgi:hypothetical protein